MLLTVLSLALRAASFIDAPLDRDEGAYALVAQQWSQGSALYRDIFDHKPPLVYIAYRFSFATAGEHLAAVRVLFALANACSAFICALIVWRLTGRRPSGPPLLASVAACVFLNSPLVQGEIANTEPLMVLATAGTAYLVLCAMGSGRSAASLPAGICAGFALLAKPVAACEAAFLAIWLATHATNARAQTLAFVAGSALPSLVWAGYALHQNTFMASVDAVLLYNLRYAGAAAVPLWARLAAIPIDYGVPLALLWAGVAGCTLTVLRSDRPAANFALGWSVAALIGTLAGGRIYDHYYQQLIPPMAVALGVTAAAIDRLALSRGARIAYAVAIVAGFWPALAAARSFSAQVGSRVCNDWRPRLAEVVRTVTAPDERLFVWGAEPYLNFAAARRPPSRYIYMYPLVGDAPGAAAARRELRAAWDQQPPGVMVVVKHEATGERGDSAATEIVAPAGPFHDLLSGFAAALETPDFLLYTRDAGSARAWSVQWEQTSPPGCTALRD